MILQTNTAQNDPILVAFMEEYERRFHVRPKMKYVRMLNLTVSPATMAGDQLAAMLDEAREVMISLAVRTINNRFTGEIRGILRQAKSLAAETRSSSRGGWQKGLNAANAHA